MFFAFPARWFPGSNCDMNLDPKNLFAKTHMTSKYTGFYFDFPSDKKA